MSSDIAVFNDQPTKTTLGKQVQWLRVRFAGITSGESPRATFHAALTMRDGTTRYVAQTVRVTEETIQLRLLKLSEGTDVRICTETDWNAIGIPVTFIDFCCVALEASDTTQQTADPEEFRVQPRRCWQVPRSVCLFYARISMTVGCSML